MTFAEPLLPVKLTVYDGLVPASWKVEKVKSLSLLVPVTEVTGTFDSKVHVKTTSFLSFPPFPRLPVNVMLVTMTRETANAGLAPTMVIAGTLQAMPVAIVRRLKGVWPGFTDPRLPVQFIPDRFDRGQPSTCSPMPALARS